MERATFSQAASDMLPPAKSALRPQMSSPTEDQVSNSEHAVCGGGHFSCKLLQSRSMSQSKLQVKKKKKRKKKTNLKDRGQVAAGRMFFFLNRISKLKHSLVAQVPKDRTVSYNFKNISTQ